MRTLSIDIETYSGADLKTAGVYKYVQDPDFTILLLACAFDDDPVEIYDLVNDSHNIGLLDKNVRAGVFYKILDALTDPTILKTAHNANFERTCLSQFFNIDLPIEQWECTMVKASMLGLPLSLEAIPRALGLEERKAATGKALIRYFAMPCKPTKANGNRTRNMPKDNIEKWEEFKSYCVQDVVVERDIRKQISFFEIPAKEKQLWWLDQTINDNGILLDLSFIENAVSIDLNYKEKLIQEAIQLTGLSNPNSAAQLKDWIGNEIGEEVSKLTKEAVPELLKGTDSETVKRVLTIRQETSKTSVKKYTAMVSAICEDARVRGLLQFYGANRTGRWAGRLVQVQNLPRNEMKQLDLAREVVKANDGELLELLFGNVPDVLSQLIRTSFVAKKDCRFIIADFSAIEARVIAWLAGEKWRLDVFNTHGKIYEASAAQMFKVPIETISFKDQNGETVRGPNYGMRQKGKISELALGYQGGPNALLKMGALKMGLTEEELPKLVKMWRNANRAITTYWDSINDAAVTAVEENITVTTAHNIKFFVEKQILFIQLPSGRRLSYIKPQLKPNQFGGLSLTYMGMNQTTKQWGVQDTYGGKLVENIVQAVARDCLAEAMLRINKAGYNIVMHVHDEVVLEVPEDFGSIKEVNALMGKTIDWAKGLPLTAESYETYYYQKD